jgi:transcriptional regulator with XRE-family HTH domain
VAGTTTQSARWAREGESAGRKLRVKDAQDLNERRRAAGLSHAKLAAATGSSKSMAGFLCSGDREGLSLALGEAYARALHCELADLFDPIGPDGEPTTWEEFTRSAEPDGVSGA